MKVDRYVVKNFCSVEGWLDLHGRMLYFVLFNLTIQSKYVVFFSQIKFSTQKVKLCIFILFK